MKHIINWIVSQKLYILLAAGSIFGYFWLAENKKKLNMNDLTALLLSILNSVCGVLFVKIFAFLEGEPGGMSLFGGVFFLPALYYIGAKLTKRSVADVCDIFAICTIFTVMCARINCLLSGCCGGTLIPGTDGLQWPTQMIEIVFYIILIIFLGKKVGKAETRGKIYPMYLMLYGIFRFILEFVREKETENIFHLSHLWALIAIVVGLVFYFKQSKTRKSGAKHRK